MFLKASIVKKVRFLHYLYIPADFLITFVMTFLSFLMFYNLKGIEWQALEISLTSFLVALAMILVLFLAKVYRTLTHSYGLVESIKTITFIVSVEIVFLLTCLLFLKDILLINVSYIWIWALITICTAFFIPATRFCWRLIILIQRLKTSPKKNRTLIIGAGDAAKIIIDDSKMNPASKNKVVVLVDDNVEKINNFFAGCPIKGPIANIKSIIEEFNVVEVIIAIASISRERLHEILKLLEPCPVRVRRMPLLSEMTSPNAQSIIDVDLDDLLCREPIKLDNHEIVKMLQNQTVLVTGAGGSIGSELVMQIFNSHPKTLILFDIYENSTYNIQQKLASVVRNEEKNDINIITLIGSTYNEVRVEQILKKYRPDYIYHAAAYKHVPLMEDSPAEAIRTNVVGTYNVARLADKYKVKKMILVSTDKAVRPTNVMGATKRFAETIVQYFSDISPQTQYAAVRFGNVLGSNGSVVPLFMKQIDAGGPITITDKNIIRYFMTIPEAVSLILQCSLFATGGEIFILDMGKPVKIISLAEKLIRQAGLVPYKDIQIIETGLRPGEKLFEELLLDKKHQIKTTNEKIYIEEKSEVFPIEDEIKTISKVFDMNETDDVKELLAEIITTYKITKN